MSSLAEVFGAKLNFSFIFSLIKILAYFHDRIENISLPVDFNGLFVLLGLSE
jgi:hypothetical protein